mmetsp:Transcript_59286/g.166929  ORF Transcript_59286/g.166929 Transcript_59286/m.166929 type:complete len:503 (+) Transcript_59286:133-1641(+)
MRAPVPRRPPEKRYAVQNHLPPFPPLPAHTVLQGRYRISPDKVVGEGGFAKVYKGLDIRDCKNVAVKVYKENSPSSLAAFKVSVEIMLTIGGRSSRTGRRFGDGLDATLDRTLDDGLDHTLKHTLDRTLDTSMLDKSTVSFKRTLLKDDLEDLGAYSFPSADSLIGHMDFRCCFVEILGFSRDDKGAPGLDEESNSLFVIFELGEESLEDRLQECEKHGRPLAVPELRSLHWALVSIVCGLHSQGFVHGDIKPNNIVRFPPSNGRPQWKLIDLDSAMKTGSHVHFSELSFTKTYMPPELAESYLKAIVDRRSDGRLCLSRLMDIWSVGMCAMEAIFLRPVLGPWYSEWRKETGNDVKFLTWLADKDAEPIISGDMRDALTVIDEDMCDMMEGMLVKDPLDRACIAECLTHRWFEPVRTEILGEIREQMCPAHRLDDTEIISVTDADFGLTIRPGSLPPPAAALPPSLPAPLLLDNSLTDRSRAREQTQRIAKGVTARACDVM